MSGTWVVGETEETSRAWVIDGVTQTSGPAVAYYETLDDDGEVAYLQDDDTLDAVRHDFPLTWDAGRGRFLRIAPVAAVLAGRNVREVGVWGGIEAPLEYLVHAEDPADAPPEEPASLDFGPAG